MNSISNPKPIKFISKTKTHQIWKYIGNKTEAKELNLNAGTDTKSANLSNF